MRTPYSAEGIGIADQNLGIFFQGVVFSKMVCDWSIGCSYSGKLFI